MPHTVRDTRDTTRRGFRQHRTPVLALSQQAALQGVAGRDEAEQTLHRGRSLVDYPVLPMT